jgi:hypothetical protein
VPTSAPGLHPHPRRDCTHICAGTCQSASVQPLLTDRPHPHRACAAPGQCRAGPVPRGACAAPGLCLHLRCAHRRLMRSPDGPTHSSTSAPGPTNGLTPTPTSAPGPDWLTPPTSAPGLHGLTPMPTVAPGLDGLTPLTSAPGLDGLTPPTSAPGPDALRRYVTPADETASLAARAARELACARPLAYSHTIL